MVKSRFKFALVWLLFVAPTVVDAAIALPLPWQQGQTVRYQSSSVQEKVRAGQRERTETREISVLEIVEANEKGFLQVWRSESPSVTVGGDGDDIAGKRDVAQQLTKRFASLSLQAELDAQGSYTGIRNWQELGAALREVMLPFMVRQARARPELAKADEATLRGSITPVLQRMTTQAAVNSTLGKQVAIYNFFTAPKLTPGKPVSYRDTMPSPWSADILPTTGSFELSGVDEKAGTVSIRWRQSIDPVKGAAVVRKMVEAITGAAPPRQAAGSLPKGLVLSDQATVVLDRKSGLPLSLLHRREVALGDSSSVTTWTLTKLENSSP